MCRDIAFPAVRPSYVTFYRFFPLLSPFCILRFYVEKGGWGLAHPWIPSVYGPEQTKLHGNTKPHVKKPLRKGNNEKILTKNKANKTGSKEDLKFTKFNVML